MKTNVIAATVLFLVAGLLSGLDTARGSVEYVTNYSAGTISRIPDGGGVATTFATGLDDPHGIAVSSTGIIYVANQNTRVIDAVSPAGVVTPFADLSKLAGGLSGLAIDAANNLYVSGQTTNIVIKVTPSGATSTYATGVGSIPLGLALDAMGDLFVADLDDRRIDRVGPGGGAATAFATLAGGVRGVTTDAAGDVYAGSYTGGYVEEFSPTGVDLGRYGTVAYPWGLAFDAAGDLLVNSNDPTDSGTTVYSIAPGGGTSAVYATGLSTPLFIATAVPEPATLGLLVMFGMTGLISRRRRQV